MLETHRIIMRPLAMFAAVLIIIVMLPAALAPYFAGLNVEPPLTTRTAIGWGNFWAGNWPWFLSVIFLAAIFLKTKKGKKFREDLVLKTPVISLVAKKINVARTIQSLASLIIAGRPLAESLETISKTVKNIHYQKTIAEIAGKVRGGERLSAALRNYAELFPLTVSQAIEVGEDEGKLSIVLEKLGDFFEGEALDDINNLKKKIELVLMVLLGGIIGFLAVSFIQPLILS